MRNSRWEKTPICSEVQKKRDKNSRRLASSLIPIKFPFLFLLADLMVIIVGKTP